MTTSENVPTETTTATETTEVAVEKPATVTDTVEVAATPETAGEAKPDEATESTEAEPKE